MPSKMKKAKHNHGPLDYNYIAEGIYIGTNQCCQGHFDEELLAKGITADISLEKGRLDAPFGVHYYAWIPVKDHAAPTLDQLELGVRMLQVIVKQKRGVYVHCKNGHGRAPTLVVAYFISTGMTREEAIRVVSKRRRGVHLEQSQKKMLEAFVRVHKLKRS